ncbi:MAG: right-handed parallel beta-helix repeat-containing protein [Candidatus Lokiarchaeota archaeon]|nr:right-handed parallel beta-helix repeat-containing protein [Candidatus Harpocratesius repetitus]
MLSKKKKSKNWIIIGSVLLILLVPGVFIISNRNHIFYDSKTEAKLIYNYSDSKIESTKTFDENIPHKSSGTEISSFNYGSDDIIKSIPITTKNGDFIILGNRGDVNPNFFIVKYPNEMENQFITPTDEYIIDTKLYPENSETNIFVIENTKENSINKVCYFSIELENLQKNYENQISLGDNCWCKQMISLPNGNLLILIKSIENSIESLNLFEINLNSGVIENQKTFPHFSNNVLSDIELGSLNYISIINTDEILLVAENHTKADAGIVLSKGIFGESWTNVSIHGDLELIGSILDSDNNLYLALKYDNSLSNQNELSILKYSSTLSLLNNATLKDPSKSYNLIDFRLGTIDNYGCPFIVYSIWDSSANYGLGFSFVQGNSFLSQIEKNPNDTYEYFLNGISLFNNGDICLAISSIHSSDIVAIILYRVNKFNNYYYNFPEYSYSQFSLFTVIGESSDEQLVFIGIQDFGNSGVIELDKFLNGIVLQINLDSNEVCKSTIIQDDSEEYILFYGYQGDYFSNNANAIIEMYHTSGTKIISLTLENLPGYSQTWEWLHFDSGTIYLAGSISQYDITTYPSLLIGILTIDNLKNGMIYSSNIEIHNIDQVNNYKQIGILKGSGNEQDPYIIENLIIDGNRESVKGDQSGIDITYSDYWFIIRNCEICNLEESNTDTAGISISNCDFVLITNNTISNCDNGIKIYNSNNGTISANNINSCQYNGIIITDNFDGDGSNGNIIYDNSITNTENAIEVWYGNGIWLASGEHTLIYNNTITQNANYGIYIDNAWNYDENPKVQHSRIHDNNLNNNREPYNSGMDERCDNRLWNNIGADDFPEATNYYENINIPGYSLGLILSTNFCLISFLFVATKIIIKKEKRSS